MNKNILYIGILLVGLLTAGCTQTGTADNQAEISSLKAQLASKDAELAAAKEPKIKEIAVNGGPVLTSSLKHVAEAFEAKHGIKVNVDPKMGKCGYSQKGLVEGTLDAGAFCCPLNKYDTGSDGLADMGAVGKDAIIVMVNKDNPVDGLTTQQIRDIYQGEITNWKEVGGNDAAIEVHAHIHCGHREDVMRQYLVGVRNHKAGIVGIDNSLFVDSVTNTGEEDMIPTIVANPNAIGHNSRIFVDDSKVKVISVDGVIPTDATIADETYPIVRYLHMATAGTPNVATSLFLDYVRSDEGQKLLAKEGIIVPLP
jgi:phosphate transport system substrate-binding protein